MQLKNNSTTMMLFPIQNRILSFGTQVWFFKSDKKRKTLFGETSSNCWKGHWKGITVI